MATRSRTVQAAMGLRLVAPGAAVIVDAVLRYDVDDPYAMHVTFRTGPGENGRIEWLFARHLLGAGLVRPPGAGVSRFSPAAACVYRAVYPDVLGTCGRARP